LSVLCHHSGSDKDDVYFESWGKFGRRVERYISKHRDELDKDSYDLILGFSRGGTILAFIFACLLKDSTGKPYSQPLKASVRAIPRGITCKKKDPCFVMNQAASDSEMKDILINLKGDLKKFSKKIKRKLNVLLMDDNLTGATRVMFLENYLDELDDIVAKRKTLAYVRHSAFLKTEIPTITKFPKNKQIFIMPWHEYHKKMDLRVHNENTELSNLKDFQLKFYFELYDNISTESIKNLITEGKLYRFKGDILINGACDFVLKVDNNLKRVILEYTKNKVYPPKRCLKPLNLEEDNNEDNNDVGGYNNYKNDFVPLCSDEKLNRTKATCLVCSIINCNKLLFRRVMVAANSNNSVSINIKWDDPDAAKLKDTIRIWSEKSDLKLGILLL